MMAVLIRRAELAAERARDLMIDDDRWRQRAIEQLEYMLERGAEFRSAGRTIGYPMGPPVWR
jgi:hypothetical protein